MTTVSDAIRTLHRPTQHYSMFIQRKKSNRRATCFPDGWRCISTVKRETIEMDNRSDESDLVHDFTFFFTFTFHLKPEGYAIHPIWLYYDNSVFMRLIEGYVWTASAAS